MSAWDAAVPGGRSWRRDHLKKVRVEPSSAAIDLVDRELVKQCRLTVEQNTCGPGVAKLLTVDETSYTK